VYDKVDVQIGNLRDNMAYLLADQAIIFTKIGTTSDTRDSVFEVLLQKTRYINSLLISLPLLIALTHKGTG